MKKIIVPALVIAVTAAVFLPSIAGRFTNWDDAALVTDNPAIKKISVPNVLSIFTSSFVGTYIPLTVLSFAAEYHFFRLAPRAYHLTNLILHLLNSLLVLVLVRLLTKDWPTAGVVSLLFGIHPLHVEAVAWVTERKSVLYTFFFLLGLIAYAKYLRRPRAGTYVLVAASFLLALMSKPMAITLPFVLLLLDYFHRRPLTNRVLAEKLPLLIIAAGFFCLNLLAQQTLQHGRFQFPLSFFLVFHNLIFYLAKIFVPVNLSAYYPYPAAGCGLPLTMLLSPLIAAAIALDIVLLRRRAEYLVFGALFFLITILPVIQLIPLVGAAAAADRYVYVPALGIFFAAASFLRRLYGARLRARPLLRGAGLAAGVLVVAALSLASRQRIAVWHNSLALWNDVLRQFPDQVLALNNRGQAYAATKDYRRALADYNRAAVLDSMYGVTFFNRAGLFYDTRDYRRALDDYDRALRRDANRAAIYAGRGRAYFQLGRTAEAAADYERALKINPALADVHNDRGILYFGSGDYARALQAYNRCLALDPDHAPAYANRADLYFLQGNTRRAIADYTRSIAVDPAYADAYYNRGVAYGSLGQADKALADYEHALVLNPQMATAYNNRGNIYLHAGEYDIAVADYSRALELDSAYAGAYYNRALANYRLARFGPAVADLEKAEKYGYPVDARVKMDFKKELKEKEREKLLK